MNKKSFLKKISNHRLVKMLEQNNIVSKKNLAILIVEEISAQLKKEIDGAITAMDQASLPGPLSDTLKSDAEDRIQAIEKMIGEDEYPEEYKAALEKYRNQDKTPEPEETEISVKPEPEVAQPEDEDDDPVGPEEVPVSEPEDEFDPEAEDLETLKNVSKEFIDTFYEKEFLSQQGELITSVLNELAKIVEKEEQEKAARRSKSQDSSVVSEQEESNLDKNDMRNIQVDLKSFLRLLRKSKAVLSKFEELRAKGSVVAPSYKKDFMKVLSRIQSNIATLVKDLSGVTSLNEAVDKSETLKKWDAIEKGYKIAARALSNIEAAGTTPAESFDMEKNVKDAYDALMSITGYFPTVNPFGAKTTNFNEYSSKYDFAIDEVKNAIRDILELSQGRGGRNTAANAIEALKDFSGQIQSIFGENASSQFKDYKIDKESEAYSEERPLVAMVELDDETLTNIKDELKKEAATDLDDPTEVIQKIASETHEQLDDETKTKVSVEEVLEATEMIYQELDGSDETAMLTDLASLIPSLQKSVGDYKEEYGPEQNDYIDAFSQAVFEVLQEDDLIGDRDNPKFKSKSALRPQRTQDGTEIFRESRANVLEKLTDKQKSKIKSKIPKDQSEWYQNYIKTNKPTTWFDQKKDFSDLIYSMVDLKIIEYFSKKQAKSGEPSWKKYGLNDREIMAINKLKEFLSSKLEINEEQIMLNDQEIEFIKEFISKNEQYKNDLMMALRKISDSKIGEQFKSWAGFKKFKKSEPKPAPSIAVQKEQAIKVIDSLINEMLQKGN